uniref:Uncharacterized protein n=1 Tax=Setaria italica TaxID=4555 RepID=K3Z1I1_SETIT
MVTCEVSASLSIFCAATGTGGQPASTPESMLTGLLPVL